MSTKNGSTNALVILTDFERKLAACTTVGDAKQLRDEAEVLRHYCQTMQVGLAAQNRCAVARYMAERKLGEILKGLPRSPGPGRGKKISAGRESFLKQLEAEGIRYPDARRWQRMARVPEDDFRWHLEQWCGGDGLVRGMDPDDVDRIVDLWMQRHPTPAEDARRAKRWKQSCDDPDRDWRIADADDQRETAWLESTLGGYWDMALGTVDRMVWALKDLRRNGGTVDTAAVGVLLGQIQDSLRVGMEADKTKMFAVQNAGCAEAAS